MAKARIPLAGSIFSRGTTGGGTDQTFQNCYSYSVSDPMTGGTRIYTDKRRGWSATAVADSIRSTVGGCVWQNQSKLAFPFVMGTPEVGETPESITGVSVYDQGGTIIGALISTVTTCYGLNETIISGTGNLIGAFAGSATEGWYYPNAGTWTKITDTDFPPNQTPAIALTPTAPVSMDGYVFWMTTTGRIYNSDLNSVSSYTSTGFITADVYPDGGVGIARSGNYIVAFGTHSIQFFVNNGNPTGSPLSVVPGAAARIGCSTGSASFMTVGNALYFTGINVETGQRGIYQIVGTEIKKISTPAVDELIFSQGGSAYCYGALKFAGFEHIPFGIGATGHPSPYIYSPTNGRWWYLTNAAGDYITCGLSLGDTNTYISSHRASNGGYLLRINSNANPAVYTDSGGTVTMTIQTMPLDMGSDDWKFCSRLTLIGDKQSSTATVTVSWSDDDGVTFTSGVTIDMSSANTYITRLGRFKRRVFKFVNSTNTPLRLEAFELEYTVGS